MRDSKIEKALEDVSQIARAKLGDSWAEQLMLYTAMTSGFTPIEMTRYDGELVQVCFSKLVREVSDGIPAEGSGG